MSRFVPQRDELDDELQRPRPSFANNRPSSYSSADSIDPPSTSDSDSPSTVVRKRQSPSKLAPSKPTINTSSAASPQSSYRAKRRSRQASASGYATVDTGIGAPSPFSDNTASGHEWSADALYQDASAPPSPRTADLRLPRSISPITPGSSVSPIAHTNSRPTGQRERTSTGGSGVRPPPSSFAFPFQAYPGNPDPGTSVPGSRRNSLDSIRRSSDGGHGYFPSSSSYDHGRAISDDEHDLALARPQAPFMAAGGGGSAPSSGSGSPVNSRPNSLYRNSAGAAMSSDAEINRKTSFSNMRAPFLSPSSRPGSVRGGWTPPSYISAAVPVDENGHPLSPRPGDASPNGSSTFLAPAVPRKAPLRSTLISGPISKDQKPWLQRKDRRGRFGWWLTFFCFLAGVGVSAIICWRGVVGVRQFKDSELCSVMEDNFDGGDLDGGFWNKVVELGGFGNGEFEMTTPDNVFLQNGELYLYPSLTSDDGTDVFRGDTFSLGNSCTNQHNESACAVTPAGNTIIPPVKAARINTKGKVAITYGKVEVKAKLPRGDWLWPAIWMLPDGFEEDEAGRGRGMYGVWPLSGEIDIMESRGNGREYKHQGNNFVRSSLNYGPMDSLVRQLWGWYSLRRQSFSDSFHTYALEWDQDFMRFYTDNKLHSMLNLRTRNSKEGFFHRGGFPQTAQNGSSEVVIQNPWTAFGNDNAPYDQPFYLIVSLSAGGTSGWFPDGVGDKPWYDGSGSAMFDFAFNQANWYSTWPESQEDRAFRIESVKVWQKC